MSCLSLNIAMRENTFNSLTPRTSAIAVVSGNWWMGEFFGVCLPWRQECGPTCVYRDVTTLSGRVPTMTSQPHLATAARGWSFLRSAGSHTTSTIGSGRVTPVITHIWYKKHAGKRRYLHVEAGSKEENKDRWIQRISKQKTQSPTW